MKPTHLALAGLLLAGVFFANPARALPAGVELNVSAKDVKAIDRGEIVVLLRDTSESMLKDVLCVGYVNAPADRVWDCIEDYPNYPKMFPRLLKSETRGRLGNIELHYTLVDYPWPFGPHWTLNRVVEADNRRKMTWKRQEGTIKEVAGSWELFPDGDKTLVVYSTRIDPGVPFLPAWVIDWGSKQIAPQIIEAVRKYSKPS